MVKQWNGGDNPETAEEADWLLGGGVFYEKVGIKAVRSMKEPGSAYTDTVIGSDTQPGHMDDYQDLPDDADNDSGGVHFNSGIPNKAFYLLAMKLGGYSWDVAGKLWYDCLCDKELKTFAAEEENWTKVFEFFAELTAKHAAKYEIEGMDVVKAVKEAWEEVGVQVGDGSGKGAKANGISKAGKQAEESGDEEDDAELESGEEDGEEEEGSRPGHRRLYS